VTETGFPGALELQALRLGRLVRVEEQLVEVLGVQLARAADAAVVVALADRIRCHRHAASIVRDRLPVLREFPVDRLVDDASVPEWTAALEALQAAEAEDAIRIERALTVALADAYRGVVAVASPAGAPSVRRHLAALAETLDGDGPVAPLPAGFPTAADLTLDLMGRS
jgi:hypothetical protein